MVRKTLLVAATAAAAVTALTGCNTVNNLLTERTETVEYYRIYDIKTDAKIKPVVDAALTGLTYTTTPRVQRHIPTWKELPDEPGRFSTADVFSSNSNFARLMASAGSGIPKVATCDGAVWTAVANRDTTTHGAKLYACLWPYKGGYHLDMFATFTKVSGGLSELSRQASYAMVGTPEQWVEKMLLDAPREIRKATGAKVTIVEAYPEVGETTWLDEGDAIEDKSTNGKF